MSASRDNHGLRKKGGGGSVSVQTVCVCVRERERERKDKEKSTLLEKTQSLIADVVKNVSDLQWTREQKWTFSITAWKKTS